MIDSTSYAVSTAYDGLGRAYKVTYPNGTEVETTYSASGQAQSIKNAATGVVYWKADIADARGNVTATTLGNGVKEYRTYAAATGFLTAIQSNGPGGTAGSLQNLSYTFNALGNLTRRQDLRASLDETFVYDGLNRVTSVSTITPGPQTSTVTVAYAANGNIASKSDVGAYTYGTGFSQAALCGGAGIHAVTAIAGAKNAQYCYDANGALVSGDNRTVTWGAFQLPTRIVQGTRAIDLVYGPDRARVKRIDSNETGLTTTHYVAGGGYEVATTSALCTRSGSSAKRAGPLFIAFSTPNRRPLWRKMLWCQHQDRQALHRRNWRNASENNPLDCFLIVIANRLRMPRAARAANLALCEIAKDDNVARLP